MTIICKNSNNISVFWNAQTTGSGANNHAKVTEIIFLALELFLYDHMHCWYTTGSLDNCMNEQVHRCSHKSWCLVCMMYSTSFSSPSTHSVRTVYPWNHRIKTMNISPLIFQFDKLDFTAPVRLTKQNVLILRKTPWIVLRAVSPTQSYTALSVWPNSEKQLTTAWYTAAVLPLVYFF